MLPPEKPAWRVMRELQRLLMDGKARAVWACTLHVKALTANWALCSWLMRLLSIVSWMTEERGLALYLWRGLTEGRVTLWRFGIGIELRIALWRGPLRPRRKGSIKTAGTRLYTLTVSILTPILTSLMGYTRWLRLRLRICAPMPLHSTLLPSGLLSLRTCDTLGP